MERNLFTGKRNTIAITGQKHESAWKDLGIKIKGAKVMGKTFQGKYKYDAIRAYIQKLSNALAKKDPNVQIQTAIHFKDSNQWRGANFTDVGESIELFDPSDSDVNHGQIVDCIQVYAVKK